MAWLSRLCWSKQIKLQVINHANVHGQFLIDLLSLVGYISAAKTGSSVWRRIESAFRLQLVVAEIIFNTIL